MSSLVPDVESASLEAVPSSLATPPAKEEHSTVWSGPAFATGGFASGFTGCQAGYWFCAGMAVRLAGCVPSAFATQIWVLFSTAAAKAISAPSGEKAGWAPGTSCVCCAGAATVSFHMDVGAAVACRVNAIVAPSGDH